ncbi:MAG TPA: hypothetical protein VFW71_08110 [Actinomycetota bacterium]|nr:hypothetical protein [Actinomycetota bacterium]
MKRGIFSRLALVATTITAGVVLFAGSAQAASIPLVNLTIPGPIGGVNVCVDTNCVPVNGVANVHIGLSLDAATIALLPIVSFGTQPGCTANVDLAVTITSPGISGVLDGVISFDITNYNGQVIGSKSIPIGPLPVGVPSSSHTVSVCGTVGTL